MSEQLDKQLSELDVMNSQYSSRLLAELRSSAEFGSPQKRLHTIWASKPNKKLGNVGGNSAAFIAARRNVEERNLWNISQRYITSPKRPDLVLNKMGIAYTLQDGRPVFFDPEQNEMWSIGMLEAKPERGGMLLQQKMTPLFNVTRDDEVLSHNSGVMGRPTMQELLLFNEIVTAFEQAALDG